MNPGLILLRKLRGRDPLPEPRQVLPSIHTQDPVGVMPFFAAGASAWVARQHPALWQLIVKLDRQLQALETQGNTGAGHTEKLQELGGACRQVESLRDGSWSALLVKSSILDGEEVWVVKTQDEALAVA